ncbi:hypothetical protein N7456_001346 [Penicillium angulare]|uniref:Nudix hydrolase domain-containing protein n=1 Tax=Penicillium angulare TaxID=116970 RepID=A0A9W9GDR2_9EURO|nr:hypothetical protein N7456_001346 [Penicillium angulare]
MLSKLNVIEQCDKFPYPTKEPDLYTAQLKSFYKFHVEGCPATLGWMLESTVRIIQWPENWKIDHDDKTVILAGTSVTERSARMMEVLQAERTRESFKVLKGWRNELFPVYGPEHELLLSIERAGSPLFGIMIYGVHMNAYIVEDGKIKYWVGQRSQNKQTYPGLLDNSVGGGIATGGAPLDTMVQESVDEAAFPEELLRQSLRPVGAVTYFDVRDERAGGETGLLQPECIYVYDILLPSGVIPKPADDEAEKFHLMDVDVLQTKLSEGKFKTNCGLVIVDFLIRHGIVTPENEKDYIEILARLHRHLEFPTGRSW